jgi:hypothetical protein
VKSRIRFRVGLMALAVAGLWGTSFQRAAAQVPDENRKELVEALGTFFIVFREKVLDELKVSDDQREKLMQHLMERIMETGPFLDSLTETGPEREKKLNEHTWSNRHNQGATRKRFDRKSSGSARTMPRSSRPSSPTPRKSSGMRCLAHRLSCEIDRGSFHPRSRIWARDDHHES